MPILPSGFICTANTLSRSSQRCSLSGPWEHPPSQRFGCWGSGLEVTWGLRPGSCGGLPAGGEAGGHLGGNPQPRASPVGHGTGADPGEGRALMRTQAPRGKKQAAESPLPSNIKACQNPKCNQTNNPPKTPFQEVLNTVSTKWYKPLFYLCKLNLVRCYQRTVKQY